MMTVPRPRLLVAVTDPKSTVLLKGQLADARARGFEVYLLTGSHERARAFAVSEQVELIEVSMKREPAPMHDLRCLARIYGALRRVRPTIVNAGTPKAGFLVTLAAFLARVPCRVYTIRGLRADTTSGLKRWILLWFEKITARLAHKVICVSPSLRDRCVALGLTEKRRTAVLGRGSSNGIDLTVHSCTREARAEAARIRQRLGIPAQARVLGFVGRVVRDKGIRELLAAWQVLRAEFADLHLVVVGSSERGDPISRRDAEILRTDNRIHWVGEVDDTIPYYLLMDVVALPSYREGFGNVLLEAAAMERPVVATRTVGCVDAVIDGLTGSLVPVGDAAALARAIHNYVIDENLRLTHGRNGRRHVEKHFRNTDIWRGLWGVYQELLNRKHIRIPKKRDNEVVVCADGAAE